MPSFASSTLRLLRRVLGTPSRDAGPFAGSPTVLDGNTAVVETEAAIGETAGLGGSFPADAADLAWRTEQRRLRVNLAGAPLSSQTREGPRGALAAAIGLAMSGTRATSFLSGPDLACAQDLLSVSAGNRLPLVTHLVGRTVGGQGPSLGNGHEAFHMGADAGCFVLAAVNVQEAVDFTLIARQAAEQALHPGIVAMDGEQTALAVQDVRFPPAGLVDDFLGSPDGEIPAPTPAQPMLFGDTRRRVPRWHDPDHPVMLGARQPPEVGGPGRSGGHTFFHAHLREALDTAFARFGKLTGRLHGPVSSHRLDDAKLVLVAMGAAVETAEAVADHVRKDLRLKVGVAGVRCLRPFPGGELARLIGRGVPVCVLECSDTPLAEDSPLLRELRAALDRSLENSRFGEQTHPGYPALSETQKPRLLSVIYGLGGLPLRGADLIALCRDADRLRRSRVFLGIGFSPTSSAYPKRQVLLDRLRRSYPHIADLGVEGRTPTPDLRPAGSLTLAVHRLSGGSGEGLTTEAAALFHRLAEGGLRGRPALPTEPWGGYCADRITSAPLGLRDPGDETPVDLAMLLTDQGLPEVEPHAGLGAGRTLAVLSALPKELIWARLPEPTRTAVKDGEARLYGIAPPKGLATSPNEYLLGAACGLLLKQGLLDVTPRRLISAREEMLRRSVSDVEQQLGYFETGLDAPREIEVAGLPQTPTQATSSMDDEAPALVRRFGTIDDSYDSLPRFWDQVGVLYKNGATAELSPDPYLAVGAIPPLSAGFRDLSALRDTLPAFDPALCTGCGDCWSGCPDSAIGAVALTPAQILDAGIRRTGADALRPLASKLATGVADLCHAQETRRNTAGELISEAYDKIKGKLPFPDERKAAIEDGLNRVVADLGCLPLAVTAPLFTEQEAKERLSGTLLSLSLDPGACKACGICVRSCAAGALHSSRQGSQFLTRARQVRAAWELLPDTDPAAQVMAAQHPDIGPLAAALLGRGAARAMAGNDGTEPGSGARLALRLTLATLESRQAPLFEAFQKEIEATREKIGGLIRTMLAEALPADDLDALARGLEGVDSRQTDLTAFLGEDEDAINSALDASRLRRLVDLARALGDLSWRLSQGRQGLGRARLGLVLSPGEPVGWAGAFPNSPFAEPVTLDRTGDGAALAAGLLEGQLRQATQGFVLMRKARMELEHPEDAVRLWPDLDGLTWRELDAKEQALCPSLLLAGDSGMLGGRGLAQVAGLLGSDLPLRMLLLADLDLGLTASSDLDLPLSAVEDAGINLGLLAIAQRGACIAQTSIGAPDHLAESLDRAVAHRGPSLLHVHAPSPTRHGFTTDRTLERARMAVAARVFPLFRYDPAAEGVFGSRINLEGNPAPREAWEAISNETSFTPAHWALGERRFSDLFAPLADDAPGPVHLAEYLVLPERERRKKTPFVEKASNGGEAQRFGIDERLVQVSAERLQAWRVLQELAGLVTPFTARVQQEAEERVAAERRAELEAQREDYEGRLRRLRSEYQEGLRHDIRQRLMALAGYGRSSGNSGEQGGAGDVK